MFESKSSAIPYANAFLAHWTQVEAHIGGGPSFFLPEKKGVIPPGFNRSGLVALRDVLSDQLDAVQDKLNLLQGNSGALAIKKAVLLKRMRLLLEVVDGYYVETKIAKMRPDAPSANAAEEKFMGPFRDAKSLWARINAEPAPSGVTLPLTLNEGTTGVPVTVNQAAFATSIQELADLYAERAQLGFDLKFAREQRDETILSIYAVLLSYRSAVLPRISTNQPLINTVPRLSPEGGHTPDPVTVEAELTGGDTATMTHSESAEPTFARYEILGAPGENAELDDATVLATRTERTPAPFTSQLGLADPGGALTLWVKVVLETGNERTSEAAVVLRPL